MIHDTRYMIHDELIKEAAVILHPVSCIPYPACRFVFIFANSWLNSYLDFDEWSG